MVCWPERKHNSYLNHLENQIVVDLAFWIWIQCILGLVLGGVVRVAISQSLFQLWSVQYPGYVLCISEQHCIQDGSPQISKFVIVCLYLQNQDVWWISIYIYTLFYILSTFGWDYQAAQKSRLHACGWTSSTWKWMCVGFGHASHLPLFFRGL